MQALNILSVFENWPEVVKEICLRS